MGGLIGDVTSEKSGLYPKDKVYLIDKLIQKDMRLYQEDGNYVEILTIKKEASENDINSLIIQLQNVFYGAYHSAVVDLHFCVSRFVTCQIISKAVLGGIFNIYSYDDGSLVHIYAYITGGNGPGRISIYQKLSNLGINHPSVNIILNQSKTIPEGANLIE